MLLSALKTAVGDGLLRSRGTCEDDPQLSEVLLDDGMTAIGPDQIVLATRPGGEQSLVDHAVEVGCRAVVVSSAVTVEVPGCVNVLETDVAWTQLFVLFRTMLLSSHDEASAESGPGSVHGLADAVAVMVGGSVVLYDRAHRVVAYSVQGHEIDSVRRDAILGRRTPDQWIRRFTVDRTAYQTYSEPGRVVRVAEYEGLHTRLRIAVHAGRDVIGEISAAEGSAPFPPHAEEALQRAARLAIPVMLRHRQTQDVERISREKAVRTLLWDGIAPTPTQEAVTLEGECFVVGFDLACTVDSGAASDHLAAERFVHFLSLHLAGLDGSSVVAELDGTYWAVVPNESVTSDRLVSSAERALKQLAEMGVFANTAVGPASASPQDVPTARRTVEDLLTVATGTGGHGRVLTQENNWAELVLVAADRGLSNSDAHILGPVEKLHAHDERNESEFVTTLATYLEEFGSISSASTRLFLHPNTLRHRMQRIADVSGLDLNDADQRLAAMLAVRARLKHDDTSQ